MQLTALLCTCAHLHTCTPAHAHRHSLAEHEDTLVLSKYTLGSMQVAAGILIKPPNTSNLRRVCNLTHWTLGRSALALGIANVFIGMYLSSNAYKNIIAQAV